MTFMKQNEIWLINLDPTIGAEIRKTRPAIIVNDDALGKLPLKIIVPITDWKENYEIAPWTIQVNPLVDFFYFCLLGDIHDNQLVLFS